MKCSNCKTSFNIEDNLSLGSTDGDCAEVRLTCPLCSAGYYTFTDGTWVSEDQAHALIRSVGNDVRSHSGITPTAQFALSIRQPWAWLILNAGKNVENREWQTKFRGPCYIHAAKTMTRADYQACRMFLDSTSELSETPLPKPNDLARGGIVGIVTIKDCVSGGEHENNPWAVGPWCFELSDPVSLPFTAMPGKLGFFRVPSPLNS